MGSLAHSRAADRTSRRLYSLAPSVAAHFDEVTLEARMGASIAAVQRASGRGAEVAAASAATAASDAASGDTAAASGAVSAAVAPSDMLERRL